MSRTDERDIYRTAKLLIDQSGAVEVEIYAAQCVDQMTADGKMEGRRVWIRIMEAVRELSATEPGTTVH